MNPNKGSRLVPSETEVEHQIKTPQKPRPRVSIFGNPLLRNALRDLEKQNERQAKTAEKEAFIEEKRKASMVADHLPEAPSVLTNSQTSQNATVANSPLENFDRKRNNHIKSGEDKLLNKEQAQSNCSNFSAYSSLVKGKTKDSYEQGTNRSDNVENHNKDVSKAYQRTQNEWKGERKPSYNEGNWDDRNRNGNECKSSYPNGTSKPFIHSSSVNNAKKFDQKVSKPIKAEGNKGGENDLEESSKRSGNIDDGRGPISKTDNDSLDTVKQSKTSSQNFKSPENKYDHPFQNKTSTQSFSGGNSASQYSNSKENYKRSISMPLAEPAPINRRVWHDFSGKDNHQYNSALHSQPAISAKEDFNGRNHNQNTISTSIAQSSPMQKSVKQNLGSRETDKDSTYRKTELEKVKNPDTNDTSQVVKEEESGWPKLDLDDVSYGDDWNDANSIKGNKHELNCNSTIPYQRSNSTPFDQSSSFSNNKKWEESNKNRHYYERGGGDCSSNIPRSDRSKFEQDAQSLSKSQLTRSKSFRDKTNFRDDVQKNANNQNSRAVDDCNAGYSGRRQNCQASSNYNDKKSFNKSRNRDTNGCSNPTNWNRAWRENRDSQMEGHQDIDYSSESIMPGPYRHSPNRSETIMHKETSCLKDKVQGVDINDEWSSETSEVTTVVLENDSSKNLRGDRVVVQSVNDLTNFSITRNYNSYPKKDNDQKTIEDTAQNSCAPTKIDDEVLLQAAYFDPLEQFFTYCSMPIIPEPRPAPMVLDPVHNAKASNAGCLIEKQTSQSSECSSFTELDPVESPASCELSDEMPDERQFQEITLFLKDLETEKSMPVEISKKIFQDVVNVVKYYFKGYFVYSYGSYSSGLAVSTSNFNLALKSEIPIRNSFLLQVQKTLSKGLQGYQVEPFDEDKNPKKSKICFTETKTGITCEMGYFGSCVSNYRKMDKLLSEVCRFDPRIKTLLIATRIWAEVCLINEPEEGKLHTIGYTLLMLHFLQDLEKPLLPILEISSLDNLGLNPLEEKNDSSVGELWLAFLKYYGKEFNWQENVITIHGKTTVLKSSKSWEQSLITIEDPFSQTNIAETVVSPECAECIFSCFKASYQYFSTPVDYEDSDSSDSGITATQNTSKREIFSFNDITFDQYERSERPLTVVMRQNMPQQLKNLPSVCEVCEELNEPCAKCRPSKEVILQPLSALSDVSLEYVNKALNEVYEEFILPDSKIEGRLAFVRDLENNVKQIYPSAKLTLFGSSVNAFGFKRSDLDICMTLSHLPRSNMEKAAILRNLVRHLRKKPQHYDNIFGLYHAKIPIVKFHFIHEDWNCDLSLYNVLAVHNSKLLSRYALFDERCRILGCAMKLLAKKACLDDTRSLSSYSYILAVIHYLQQVEPPVLPVLPVEDKKVFEEKLKVPKEVEGRNHWLCEDVEKLKKRYLLNPKNTSSVGELWLGLLDFYARYDSTRAITITQKEPLPATALRRCARLLNIQDPFLEKDNLGCILTDTRADQTRKVLGRARLLFGKEIHKDYRHDPKKYFFSSSNLTGQFIKEVECSGCGGFGHEKSDCLKANPFKYSKFRNKFSKIARKPYIRNNTGASVRRNPMPPHRVNALWSGK